MVEGRRWRVGCSHRLNTSSNLDFASERERRRHVCPSLLCAVDEADRRKCQWNPTFSLLARSWKDRLSLAHLLRTGYCSEQVCIFYSSERLGIAARPSVVFLSPTGWNSACPPLVFLTNRSRSFPGVAFVLRAARFPTASSLSEGRKI